MTPSHLLLLSLMFADFSPFHEQRIQSTSFPDLTLSKPYCITQSFGYKNYLFSNLRSVVDICFIELDEYAHVPGLYLVQIDALQFHRNKVTYLRYLFLIRTIDHKMVVLSEYKGFKFRERELSERPADRLRIQTMSAISVGTLLGFLVVLLISCVVTLCACICLKKCFKCDCLSCLFNSQTKRSDDNAKVIEDLNREIIQLKSIIAEKSYEQNMLEYSARPLQVERAYNLSPRRLQFTETAPSKVGVKKYGVGRAPSVRSSFMFTPRLKKNRYGEATDFDFSDGEPEWTARI